MVSGPGLWADLGKKTKDLLYKDFLAEQKLTVVTTTSTGQTFITNGVMKGERFDGDIVTQFGGNKCTVDVKVDTNSCIHGTSVFNDVCSGGKVILTATLPDQKKGKLEVQHVSEFSGFTASIGLTSSPVVDSSAVFGSKDAVIGGEFSFDTAISSLTKYNVGVGLNKPDFNAALMLTDKGDTVKASYSHVVNPYQRSCVGAEMAYNLTKKENTYTIGGTYGLDALTTVKARLNNAGKVGAVLQHEWRPKSLITFSGEVDVKAMDKSAKLGLALNIKP